MYRLALTERASIFDFKIFEQSATQNSHLQCYQPIIHKSISKICPKCQVLKSVFSEADELQHRLQPLHSCLMRIEQKLCKEKIVFQFQSMSNAIGCMDKRFAVENSGISCLALIFKSSNPTMTILHANQSVPVCNMLPVRYRCLRSNSWLGHG